MPDDQQSEPDELAELNARIVELGQRMDDQELASADSLGTRAGTLIGFAGVVLTLTVALSRDAFAPTAELGKMGDAVSVVLYLGAVVCLLVAAYKGVRTAAPRERDRVNTKVLNTYREVQPSVPDLDAHYGKKQQQVVENRADVNTERAECLQVGFWWLLAGLGLVAAQALIIGIDRLSEVF